MSHREILVVVLIVVIVFLLISTNRKDSYEPSTSPGCVYCLANSVNPEKQCPECLI